MWLSFKSVKHKERFSLTEMESMEILESPAAFQHVFANYRTARDFTEVCASCLIPLVPTSSCNDSLMLCESCAQKKYEENQPPQDPEDAEMPLSSADVSLTLSDEDAENQACAELDRRNNINRLLLRIEEHLKGDESEDINLGLLHAEEPPPRNRIIEIAKQVLKACGYVLGAVVAVPLIAGAAWVSIVVITVAGAASPPVIFAIEGYQKHTSNRWWTYTRKQRYLAVGRGIVIGTVFLPLLAPWGIYKLFKIIGTKILQKKIYWIQLLDPRGERVLEGPDENYNRECQMESVRTHQARADFLGSDRRDSNSDRYQCNDHDHAGPSHSIPPGTASYNDGLQDSCQVDENAADVKRVLALLGSTDNEEEDEELADFEDSCQECRRTARKPDDGREALSDEEYDDYGRRDTQRVWTRNAVSETFFDVKILSEDFNERELVSGLGSGPCVFHQKRNEINQAFNEEENQFNQTLDFGSIAFDQVHENNDRGQEMVEVSRDEGAVNGAKCLDVTEELSTGVHNTVQGAEGGCTPQCQDMKDLPEKEPKKTKRRRKKRTGKQTLVENLNSPSVSAPNETQHKDELDQGTLQTQSLETSDTDHEDEKEKATEMKAENATTRKSRKDEQAKLSAEEIPRTEASIAAKGKVEEEQTEQAVPRVVKRKIRCRAAVKKKKNPKAKDCPPEQKTHEANRKKNDEKPKQDALSSSSSEHDVIALYDEID